MAEESLDARMNQVFTPEEVEGSIEFVEKIRAVHSAGLGNMQVEDALIAYFEEFGDEGVTLIGIREAIKPLMRDHENEDGVKENAKDTVKGILSAVLGIEEHVASRIMEKLNAPLRGGNKQPPFFSN